MLSMRKEIVALPSPIVGYNENPTKLGTRPDWKSDPITMLNGNVPGGLQGYFYGPYILEVRRSIISGIS